MSGSKHPSPRAGTALLSLVAALGLAVSLTACTSGSPESSTSEPPAGTAPAQTLRSSDVRLQTRVARVAGVLPEKRRARVAKGIGRVVEKHLDKAYLGDYPMRGAGAAFADFVPGVRKQARRDQRLLTGRGLKGAESVSVTSAAAYVALLAPRRHVVGATARLEVDLRVDTGRGAEKVRVRGRLMLTPTAEGWRIFGYDLSRSDLGGRKKASEGKPDKKGAGKKSSGKKSSGGGGS